MQAETLLSLPDGLVITDFYFAEATLHLLIASVGPHALCPLCKSASAAQHSSYERTFRDVPCGNYAVQIHLTTRRFFCREGTCPRQIFTERFAHFILPRARISERFRQALRALSVVSAHEAAARLARLLHLPTSVTTVRRQLAALPLPVESQPTHIGIDDFAFRRGQTYGTVIVDLDSHHILDLLPDRTTATVEAWLRRHPQVRVISRDRAGEYAQAATRGAPQAVQVADRFHLLVNAGDCLERFIHRHLALLQEASAPSLPSAAPVSRAERHLQEQRATQRAQRYQTIQELTQQGHSQQDIAQILGIARGTVITYQRAATAPASVSRERVRAIDAYLPFLRAQWEAGQQNTHVLWEAICAQGFRCSSHYLRRYLAQWRTEPGQKGRPPKAPIATPTTLPQPQRRLSPRRLRWIGWKSPTDCTATEQAQLEACVQRCPDLLRIQQALLAFKDLLAQRDRSRLDRWLTEAEHSALPELMGFAGGIRRDYAAVAAALECPFSQGPVEGQVNRIKTVKRQLYGRAGLSVLKHHLLCQAA
ncbi:MAG: ISL3 family transposase [Ktedonobacterales bacterium]|nr:ISL3 family transposase [Ktedonobacterales bacterium]